MVVAVLCLVVVGCGKGREAASPEAVAKEFVEALKAGEYAKASDLMAWERISESRNADFSTFATSQRNLIISKTKEDEQGQLQAVAARLAGAEVGPAQVSGESATVTVQTQSGPATITLRKEDKGWGVYSVQ